MKNLIYGFNIRKLIDGFNIRNLIDLIYCEKLNLIVLLQ